MQRQMLHSEAEVFKHGLFVYEGAIKWERIVYVLNSCYENERERDLQWNDGTRSTL